MVYSATFGCPVIQLKNVMRDTTVLLLNAAVDLILPNLIDRVVYQLEKSRFDESSGKTSKLQSRMQCGS